MRDEERIARALHERLSVIAGADVQLEGAGVQWTARAASGARRCQVSCFWYGAAAGLMLGMNAANARATQRPAASPHTGAEYLVAFFDGDLRIAGGRARDEDAASASVAAWLAGRPIDELEREWPYVDAMRRRLRGLLASIEARCADVARCVIETASLYQLWIYGAGRSCQVHASETQVSCTFWLGPAQVACADITNDPAGAVERWVRGACLAELAAAGATVEPHAELLERGAPAAWHWQHTRSRIADPADVLADLRPLLERLAGSVIATRFFSYSSLNRFCFSASSHYPWVDDGLPIVNPPPPGRGYFVDVGASRTECTLDEAVDLIEATLSAYRVQPFVGSAADLVIAPIDAELVRQGSSLRAALVQRGQWFGAEVARDTRSCKVGDDGRSATFREGHDRLAASYADIADTVAAIRRWLDDRCTFDDLRLDPRACKPHHYRDGSAPD